MREKIDYSEINKENYDFSINLDNVHLIKRKIEIPRNINNYNYVPFKYEIPTSKQSIVKTKEGDIITFKYLINTERENRGWVVNELKMFINGYEAGYIKMSYIPKLYWEYYKGNILRWMEQTNKIYTTKYEENSFEYKKEVILNDRSYSSWGSKKDIYEQIKNETITEEEIEKEFQEVTKYYEKKYKKEYERDKTFFIDKPLVDYSNIYDMEAVLKNNFKELDEKTKENYIENFRKYRFNKILQEPEKIELEIPEQYQISFKGKGYAKYMYKQAALWVGLNNQRLYAGLLNEQSKLVWESIINKYSKKLYFKEEIHPFDKTKKRKSIASKSVFLNEQEEILKKDKKQENLKIKKEEKIKKEKQKNENNKNKFKKVKNEKLNLLKSNDEIEFGY